MNTKHLSAKDRFEKLLRAPLEDKNLPIIGIALIVIPALAALVAFLVG